MVPLAATRATGRTPEGTRPTTGATRWTGIGTALAGGAGRAVGGAAGGRERGMGGGGAPTDLGASVGLAGSAGGGEMVEGELAKAVLAVFKAFWRFSRSRRRTATSLFKWAASNSRRSLASFKRTRSATIFMKSSLAMASIAGGTGLVLRSVSTSSRELASEVVR